MIKRSYFTLSITRARQNEIRKISPKCKMRRKSRGLTGLFLHIYKDGKIELQGQIIGVEGDKVLVQMFEWWAGEPTNVRAFDRTQIYSEDCRLYADMEVWKSVGDHAFDK
jgi:hypothetical protein